jgi:hypothetical protein
MKRAAVPSILIAVVLLAVAVIAEAQQAGKIPRIGLLPYVGSLSQEANPACNQCGMARDRSL